MEKNTAFDRDSCFLYYVRGNSAILSEQIQWIGSDLFLRCFRCALWNSWGSDCRSESGLLCFLPLCGFPKCGIGRSFTGEKHKRCSVWSGSWESFVCPGHAWKSLSCQHHKDHDGNSCCKIRQYGWSNHRSWKCSESGGGFYRDRFSAGRSNHLKWTSAWTISLFR